MSKILVHSSKYVIRLFLEELHWVSVFTFISEFIEYALKNKTCVYNLSQEKCSSNQRNAKNS